MKNRSRLLLGVLILLGGILLFLWQDRNLVIIDADTGEVYGSWPMKEKDIFSLEFIHSVNQTPVVDEFMVIKSGFRAHRTIYSSFGAGVQTQLNEGERLSYDEDGNMIISGFSQTYVKLNLIVGTVSDHILTVGKTEISLRELCGRNTSVILRVR
ncbi:DUF1850 domain-containing protein [Proteiniclasticum sp.]|uniref:DUF1850 domain-containing protein n=1 Tax=Proteiniclasticum sp. TaxID=2053595 RepID=UPI00289FB90E|nr:DUF1850 domain-containing protein [Proteiniclasticum sp.]